MFFCRSDNSTSAQDDTAEDSVAVLVSAHHRQSQAGYADESEDKEGKAVSIAGGQNMLLSNKRERAIVDQPQTLLYDAGGDQDNTQDKGPWSLAEGSRLCTCLHHG